MLKGLSKILVVVAVLCALGYTLHRFRSCQIVGASPSAELAAPAAEPVNAAKSQVTASRADQMLVYPNQAALASMKLGYEVLQANSDGSIMVLPLPPGTALQTTFVLSPAGHRSISVTGANEKCASDINVNIYRLDQESPVFTGSILPGAKKAPLLFDVERTKLSDPFLVTIKLAHGAKNNWFCNVALSWDSVK